MHATNTHPHTTHTLTQMRRENSDLEGTDTLTHTFCTQIHTDTDTHTTTHTPHQTHTHTHTHTKKDRTHTGTHKLTCTQRVHNFTHTHTQSTEGICSCMFLLFISSACDLSALIAMQR